MSKLVLSLFDYTGNAVKPWAEAGFETLIVDIGHSRRAPKPGTLCCDLTTVGPLLVELQRRKIALSDLAFVSMFPPCTDVTVAGARDFKLKGLRSLARSVDYFATCAEFSELIDCPGFIENPRSTISTYWRKPDYTFHPSDYTGFELSDNYTKLTCLWAVNDFVMPEPRRAPGLPPPDDRIHKAPPGADRAAFRSATPMGFSYASCEANAPLVKEAAA